MDLSSRDVSLFPSVGKLMEKAAKFIIKLGLCARYHSKCFSYIKPFNPVKENSELDSKVAKADLLRTITTGERDFWVEPGSIRNTTRTSGDS